MDHTKENRCKLNFKCTSIKSCRYCKIIKNGSLDFCKYQNGNECNSSVAKANSVVLETKRIGLNFKINDKEKKND